MARERSFIICAAIWPPSIPRRVGDRAQAAAGTADATVLTDLAPSMASEDFSYMLLEKPGAYIWLGNGPADDGHNLHSPRYDFNDAILPAGVEYWTRLVHRVLSV